MDYVNLSKAINYAQMLCAGMTFLVGVKYESQKLVLLKWLLLAAFIADFVFVIGYELFKVYIPHTGSFYRFVELILLGLFFRRILHNKAVKKIALYLICLLPIGFLILTVVNPTYIRVVNIIVLSSFCLMFFSEMLKHMTIERPTADPVFWAVAALLLYFSGSLFLFLIFKPLSNLHVNSAMISYAFHNVLNIVKYAIIGYAFWLSHNISKHVKESL